MNCHFVEIKSPSKQTITASRTSKHFHPQFLLQTNPVPISASHIQDLVSKCKAFSDVELATSRLLELMSTDEETRVFENLCEHFVELLAETANPDLSLLNFCKYAACVPSRVELYEFLEQNPRAIEILSRLFVGSQFLTEILLKNPTYLHQLTAHQRIADFKSRNEFYDQIYAQLEDLNDLTASIDTLRRAQQWELLRIGACDTFGLMDLKTATLQLSLLADAIVQLAVLLASQLEGVDPQGLTILAFGKLGGEELNYSSDIDLVFLSHDQPEQYFALGKQVIRILTNTTGSGLLYRVDMRLRPWGRSGALVTTTEAYESYLQSHASLWEKQALLKARPIAGNLTQGEELIRNVRQQLLHIPADQARENVASMKDKIEQTLRREKRQWGEVKSGVGSIRDIEFVVQYLQLIHCAKQPEVLSINTLDALVRLADFGFLQADEYRQLSSGYVFLRTIEHALQLTHYEQIHSLPKQNRELNFLARRLDFPNEDVFLSFYETHCQQIRKIFERHIHPERSSQVSPADYTAEQSNQVAADYRISAKQIELISQLNDRQNVRIHSEQTEERCWILQIAGHPHPMSLTMVCGLLFTYGFNIVEGELFLAEDLQDELLNRSESSPQAYFLTRLIITNQLDIVPGEVWQRYEEDLNSIFTLSTDPQSDHIQQDLARRSAHALERSIPSMSQQLLPVELEVDNNSDENHSLLIITGEDNAGFLYELCNGLNASKVIVHWVKIATDGNQVADTLAITDESGRKLENEDEIKKLKLTVVLIKHFSQLLPSAPDPGTAIVHFRELISHLVNSEQWDEQLATLDRPKVLDAMARVLGGSEFLWEDFLRIQHESLFPTITDVDGLSISKTKDDLQRQLQQEITQCQTVDEQIQVLNTFKDREMCRIDMRHIVTPEETFGTFSRDLTSLAEVIIHQGLQIALTEMQARYGQPISEAGHPDRFSLCALGKCGGIELGFASDIELLFLFESNGQTNGQEVISNSEFYHRVIELLRKTVKAKRDGVFELDFRLRPYGRAGQLAVRGDVFQSYFALNGPAWPYERQSLVKLRAIAGDPDYGSHIEAVRDQLLYSGSRFDVAAMKAIREKQQAQLVQAGTVNAKLSWGGLVDCEYLVQGLQMTHAQQFPSLKTTNTREALRQLEMCQLMTRNNRISLRNAYQFLRRLIDALRMVRGNAKDLTVPAAGTEQLEFLARRMEISGGSRQLLLDLEHHMTVVRSAVDQFTHEDLST